MHHKIEIIYNNIIQLIHYKVVNYKVAQYLQIVLRIIIILNFKYVRPDYYQFN